MPAWVSHLTDPARDEQITAVLRKGQRYVKQGHWGEAESQFRFAFEMLVHRYHRAVIGFCVNMLGQGTAQAEDLAQEVFLALWKTLPQFRHEASLRTWVFTIARYQCFDAVQQSARRDQFSEACAGSTQELSAVLPAVHEQYEQHDLRTWVQQALGQLPLAEREVLVLTYIAELPPAEMARVLGVAEASVRTRRKRALDHLREIVACERT